MSILSDIHNGTYDSSLDEIIAAVQERKKWRGLEIIYSAKIGDTVRISRNVRPKYLAGVSGTVTKVLEGKVSIDVGYKRGRFDRVITVPATLVEKP